MPKKPPLDGIEAYENESVFYAVRKIESFRGKRVVIAGGGDSALDWTLNLQPVAERVTLVHHRDGFRAAPHSVARMKQMAADGLIDFVVGKLDRPRGRCARARRRRGHHRRGPATRCRPIASSASSA